MFISVKWLLVNVGVKRVLFMIFCMKIVEFVLIKVIFVI